MNRHNSTFKAKRPSEYKSLKRVAFKPKAKPAGILRRNSKPLRAKPDRKLQVWSRKVRERDGNQCQWPGGCRTGDTRIDAHHKAKRSQRRDLKYDLSNGLCLCRTHHEHTDTHHDEAVAMGLLNTQSRELARKEDRVAA